MKSLTLAFGLLFLSSIVSAAPINFTGVEFVSIPGSNFPTGSRSSDDGISLRIRPTIGGSVLVSSPISQFNLDFTNFAVDINFTKLRSSGNGLDHDPRIFFSDGDNLFGGAFIDNTNNAVQSRLLTAQIDDDLRTILPSNALSNSLETPVFIGQQFVATIGLQSIANETTIFGSVNNGAVSTSVIPALSFDPFSTSIRLILAADTSTENYLVNSVTLRNRSTTAVPEPNALAGLGVGLLGFSLYRRRRR